MRIVITGGGGFVGLRLARHIGGLGRLTGPAGTPRPVEEIVLFDRVFGAPPLPCGVPLSCVEGDMTDAAALAALFDRPDVGVFHLASLVSAGAEQDFDAALAVNLQGHLALLEALRRLGSTPRHVFASSIAVYGGLGPGGIVDDATRPTPQTTYGMTKAAGELLVADYSRKGFVDGRSGRLSTVLVRPGAPNAAGSGFASGVLREPLAGRDYVLPVPLETVMPVVGIRTAVAGLVGLYEAEAGGLGPGRAINLPNVSVSMAESVAALQRCRPDRPLGRVTVAVDPAIDAMVRSWPARVGAARATAIGLPAEPGIDAILDAYLADLDAG